MSISVNVWVVRKIREKAEIGGSAERGQER